MKRPLQLGLLIPLITIAQGCESSPRPVKRDANASVWAASGQICSGNEYAPNAGALPAPYILGGTDVSPPTQAALDRYQHAGFLRDITLSQLQEAYKAEGIVWDEKLAGGIPGLHVLEGGNGLFTPLPGTLGYARLFGIEHRRYRPQSEIARRMAEKLKSELATYRSNASSGTRTVAADSSE